jgi:hypothetical protein
VEGVTVEFEEEDIGWVPYNSKAPIPAATATAPAPAYFRKRRLEGFTGDLPDSKALKPSLQSRSGQKGKILLSVFRSNIQ